MHLVFCLPKGRARGALGLGGGVGLLSRPVLGRRPAALWDPRALGVRSAEQPRGARAGWSARAGLTR